MLEREFSCVGLGSEWAASHLNESSVERIGLKYPFTLPNEHLITCLTSQPKF